ncbi:MAG: hypothetical protein WD673_08185 [Alphaproteobacteria bacterium]
MPFEPPVDITVAVEGIVDEAVLIRVASHLGLRIGTIHGRRGKGALLQALSGYNNAARFAPWAVLIDLDRDCDCAPPCRERWLPAPTNKMVFRVAVRAIESWLLADRDRIAALLGVRQELVPNDPDRLDDPKGALIGLARRSRRASLRRDLVPREGSGRRVGPLYPARLIEFAGDMAEGWRPEAAEKASESLARCMRALQDAFGARA